MSLIISEINYILVPKIWQEVSLSIREATNNFSYFPLIPFQSTMLMNDTSSLTFNTTAHKQQENCLYALYYIP
jgi:hypothetical protein